MTLNYSLLENTVCTPTIDKGFFNSTITWKLPDNTIQLVHNLINGKRCIYVNQQKYFVSDYMFIDNGSKHEVNIGNNIYYIVIKTHKIDFKYELVML